MHNIGTAELKNRLSAYLRRVRKGNGFLITDRGIPVARLLPLEKGEAQSPEEHLLDLVEEGFLHYPFPKGGFKRVKAVDLGNLIATQYLEEDRSAR